MVISDAGDWTRKIIAKPPTHIYTRGVPQYGVMRIAGMFEPVVVISNQSVTRNVVCNLESRGVPGYGAIFDS